MAIRQVKHSVPFARSRTAAFALTLAAVLATASAHGGTEIALRFDADDPAAQGLALSPAAQAAIEKAAGMRLIAKGRDSDGAFRFGFAVEPSTTEVRASLNNLRATGALVYADVATDERSALAKHDREVRNEAVTSLIVKTKPAFAKSMGVADPKTRLAAKAGIAIASARRLADGSQLVTLDAPLSPRAVAQVVQRLAADAEVAHVEVDRRAQTQALPSDPMYATQWNLSDPVGGIAAPRAWDLTTGDANAPVAILDTGMLPHPDLAGRVIGGYDFVADARFSNDGDGRDPDPSDPGDYITPAEVSAPDSALQGCAAANSSWHGTMVAGTFGAAANNGNGVSGVNWKNPMLNVRVMGKCGGALSDVADGIRWAAGLPVPGVPANQKPARVINLSLAGSGDCGPILQSAVTEALARGAVIVAAAGNNNTDVANHWPANCNGVIAVAATSRNGSRAFYTNSGSKIAISAPGGGIGGSIPVLRNAGTTTPDPNAYGYGQQLGSSLAAPHIAGIASLVLAMDRSLTPAEVRALIESNARPFAAVATDGCSTAICGAGMADAASTLSRLMQTGPIVSPPIVETPPSPPATLVPIPLPLPFPTTPVTPPPAAIPPVSAAPFPGGWYA